MADTMVAPATHHEGDDCDLEDPHDALHHTFDDDPSAHGRCDHPDCRADDDREDAICGLP